MTGKQFRIRRAVMDLTQAQLASELGVQPNTISRYENEDLKIPKAVELALKTIEQQVSQRDEEFYNEERQERLKEYLDVCAAEFIKDLDFPEENMTDAWAGGAYEQMDEDLRTEISYEDFFKALMASIDEKE
jgi:transcriptional regulator with XRE-family HTH domain